MRHLLPCLLLIACSGDDTDKTDTDAPDGVADTDTDTDTDSDTDTDTDTDTEPAVPVTLSNLGWSEHPFMGSLITVSWDQDQDEMVHIEYEVDPGEWRSSPSELAVAGTNERVLVGIPFDTSAEWRVVAETGTADGPTLTTGQVPPRLPLAVTVTGDETGWYADGTFLLTSINQNCCSWVGGTYWTMILDRQGRVVWAQAAPDNNWTLFAQVSVTGDHFLWDEATYWNGFPQNANDSTVHRSYLDADIETIPTPGLHHAFVELPDGTLAWGSQSHGGGEALVEKAPGQVDETVLWTVNNDWPGASSFLVESNGLFYDVDRDTYLYSFYTNSSVVEVERSTGSSMWWAGTVANGYDFVPVQSQFSWQHGISWTDADPLLLSTEGRAVPSDPISTWVREYEVDEVAGTLTELWSVNSFATAKTNGQAWRLPNGNTLHVIGSASEIKEYDAAGTTVWHVDFDDEKLLGQGEFITDLYTLLSP